LDTTYLTTLLSSKPRLALRLYQNIGFDLAGLLRALPVIAASLPEYSDADARRVAGADDDHDGDEKKAGEKATKKADDDKKEEEEAEQAPSLLPGLRRLRRSSHQTAAIVVPVDQSPTRATVRSISSTGPRSMTSDGRLTGHRALRRSRRKRMTSARDDNDDDDADASDNSQHNNHDDNSDNHSSNGNVKRNTPALPTAAVDIVQRVVNERFVSLSMYNIVAHPFPFARRYNLEFNLHDEELIEEVGGYATRRAGMWHKTSVLLSAHYLCLRTPLFGVVSRTSISLFDVVDIHLPAPGSIVLEARNKKIYHLRRRRRKKGANASEGSESGGGATASGGGGGQASGDEADQDDLGALLSSIWAALPKIRYGDHQRHMAMATGDGSVAGAPLADATASTDDAAAAAAVAASMQTSTSTAAASGGATTSGGGNDAQNGSSRPDSKRSSSSSARDLVVRLSLRRHRSRSKLDTMIGTSGAAPPQRGGGDTLRGSDRLTTIDADTGSMNSSRRTTPTFVSAAAVDQSDSSTISTTTQSHRYVGLFFVQQIVIENLLRL
jgi:hypothetical protein